MQEIQFENIELENYSFNVFSITNKNETFKRKRGF